MKVFKDVSLRDKVMENNIDFTKPDTKAWLKELLHVPTNVVRVTFTKKDGTERTMLCTTSFDKIPEDQHPKGEQTSSSDEAQRVFDLEKQEWRSFRWDSVKYIEVDL